jgi:hypothetical protein
MRLRFKIPLFGIVIIALLVVTAVVLLYQSHILENQVNRYLANRIADRYDLDVNISEIDGSFVNGFVLSGVLIRYFEDSDTITLAYLPRVNINYHVSNLWRRQWIIDSLKLVQPQLFLRRDTSGSWSLPRVSGVVQSESRPPSWELKKIAVEDASFDLSWKGEDFSWFGLNLLASAKSEEGTYTISLDSLSADSDDRRVRLKSARGLATLYEKKVALQNVNIVADSSYLTFSLVRDTENGSWVEAEIDSAHIHLPDILSFLRSNLTGDLDVSGTVYHQYEKTGGNLLLSGDFQKRRFDSLNAAFQYDEKVLYLDSIHGAILNGCAIEGFGNLDFSSRPKGYTLSARIDSFNLKNLVFDSYNSNLNGHLEMNGRGVNSSTMAIDLGLNLDESYFDIYHLHKASGQMTIGEEGLYIFPGFQVNYYDNRFMCDGGVDFGGDVTISCRADLVDLSDFEHQTFIDLPAGRATAEFSFTGPTNDPDLRAHCVSDSVWFYDFFSGDFETSFDVKSFFHRMQGPIVLECRAGEAWGFPYDSLYSEMTLDSNLLLIDTGFIANNISRTEVSGILDFESYPQELLLDSVVIDLSGRTFASDGPQSILIDSAGYIFERININASDGDLSFSGRADYSDSIDINWKINNISISPWVKLFNDSLEIDGRLSSVGSAYNTLETPEFSLTAGIDSLQFRSLVLGDLQVYLSYEDSTLLIDSSFLKSEQGLYTASGEFPINLAPGNENGLFDDREQDISIVAADKQLNLAAYILESVEYITGDFTAEIDLTGKPLQPQLNGTSSLKNGVVKLLDLQDRLEKVDVELEMSNKLVTITNATAEVPHRKGKGHGQVSGGGTVLVKEINSFLYALRLQATDMPINYELGDVTGRADAELWVNGETPPRVTGMITMPTATYRESFEETGFSLLSALEADKTWDLDLMVDFPSNFWVKNDDIDAEFSGSVNILRTAGVYNFLGTLEIIRGKYFFLDKTFKMIPGGLIMYDNIEEPDPKLDLEISTRIRTPTRFSDFESENNYSYELMLAVTGTLNNPNFMGSGDSPVSSESILPALLADYRPDVDTTAGNRVLTSRITVGGMGLLASQFSKLGTRTLGVETFEIYPGEGQGFDPLGTRVTIGAYTFRNLYVFGSSYFDINKGQEVGMEYRLGRHYLFEGRRDESNLYHLNLKLHWEY